MNLPKKILLITMVMGLMFYLDPTSAQDFEPKTSQDKVTFSNQTQTIEKGIAIAQKLDDPKVLCRVPPKTYDRANRNPICEDESDLIENQKLPKNQTQKKLIRQEDPQYFRLKQ